MQLGLLKIFIIFKRLSNLAFKPFAFDPKIEKLIGKGFSLLFFPFFLLFFNLNFCVSGRILVVDFAMGLSGTHKDFARELALLARDLTGV